MLKKYARRLNSPRFGKVWQVRFRRAGMPPYYSDDGKEWWIWDRENQEKKKTYPHCSIFNPDTEEAMYQVYKYD